MLETFAGTSDDRRAAYDELRSKVTDIRVNRDAFGVGMAGVGVSDAVPEVPLDPVAAENLIQAGQAA